MSWVVMTRTNVCQLTIMLWLCSRALVKAVCALLPNSVTASVAFVEACGNCLKVRHGHLCASACGVEPRRPPARWLWECWPLPGKPPR